MEMSNLENLKWQLTFQTQVSMPMVPFAIDTLSRFLFLRSKLRWYELPDLVTLLVTFSFFCFGLMLSVKKTTINKDDEVDTYIEVVRQKFFNIGITSMMAAGAMSFYRAFNERYPSLDVAGENGLIVFCLVMGFVLLNSIVISRKYTSYVGA